MRLHLLAFFVGISVTVSGLRAESPDWVEPCPPPSLNGTQQHVRILSRTRALAVGEKGIHLTTNGGLSWSEVFHHYLEWYYDSVFQDSLHGIVVGTNLLRTTDGGATWAPFGNSPGRIYGVDATGAQHLWAVTSKQILESTDGGESWTARHTEESKTKFFEDVAFSDELHGVAVGGPNQGFFTADGGSTWSPTSFGDSTWVNRIDFVSATVGYAAGMKAAFLSVSVDAWGSVSVTATGLTSTVWKTTDAGATWTMIALPFNSWLRGLDFRDAAEGWVVGKDGVFATTRDGGNSWGKLTIPASTQLNGISLLQDSGIAVGQSGAFYLTNNGGVTWLVPYSTKSSETVRRMFFTDASTGWAGTDSSLLHTTNGGNNWQVALAQGTVNEIQFINPERGWVLTSKSTLRHTEDGGQTWKAYYRPAHDFHFPTAQIGWLVGYGGLIAKSSDGGKTREGWVDQVSGTNKSLHAVWFLDETTGWAVGDEATVLGTRDGGNTWSPVDLGPLPSGIYSYSANFSELRFFDPQHGWASGETCMVGTTDGGRTWNFRKTPGKVTMISPSVGWTHAYGMIRRTDDGGRTWRIDTPSAEPVSSFFFLDDERGWAGCYGGHILKTTSGGAGYQLYFPWLETAGSSFTGFALANPGPEAAHVRVWPYRPDGTPADPSSGQEWVLGPNQQLARVGPELLGQAPGTVQQGWVRVKADQPLGGVFQFGSPGRMDGALAVGGSTGYFLFTRIYEGPDAFRGRPAQTVLTVVNTAAEPRNCSISLRADSGEYLEGAQLNRQIPGHGQLTGTIRELFGRDLNSGFASVAGEDLVGFEQIRLTADGSMIGLNGTPVSQSDTLYSGQMAQVPGFFTSIKLVNSSSYTRRAEFRAIGADGGVIAGPVVRDLGPHSALEIDVGELFGLTGDIVGTLRVNLDSRGVAVGDVLFGDSLNLSYAAALPLQDEAFQSAIFNHVAEGLGFFTGLALYVPGTEAAEVTVSVFGADGEPVGVAEFTMEPGTRISQLIHELVPAAEGQVGGYVRVDSTQPLIAQELFGYPGLLSAVPASPWLKSEP